MAKWSLTQMAFPDNYRQISQKRSIFAGEMQSTVYLEWAADHFGLGLMKIDPLLTKICAKKLLHFRSQ